MIGTIARWLWASPWTLFGITIGVLNWPTGTRCQAREGLLEFHGGGVAWLLKNATFLEGGASAMTLGHVVLGRTPCDLDRCRRHEKVHVRQYERWGPFFIPAYLLCSFVLYCRGRDGYHDNPFETEAFEVDDAHGI